MIQVQSPAPLISKLLREQTFNDAEKYRLASYILEVRTHSGVLIYNVLTKELLLVKSEYLENKKTLVKKWFLVPIGFDEKLLIDQVKLLFSTIHQRDKEITNYTIFTTTDCNARCYYCFEKGTLKLRMNEEVIRQIIQYISTLYNHKEISIQWFGGEPLYNMHAINMISKELNSLQVKFNSSITTNGYLFTEDIIQTAITIWHLKSVQVTLDGTETVYNQTKAYIYKNKNPFQKVINNIDALIKADVQVVIRLNLTNSNYDDLMFLIEKIALFYGNNKNLKVYSMPLFDLITDDNIIRKELFDKLNKLQDLISELHLEIAYEYFSKCRINHCKADNNGKSLVIFPDGNMGLCEHEWGGSYIGNIFKNHDLDEVERKTWQLYETIERCNKCTLYPNCLKLIRCDTNKKCYDELLSFEERRLRDTVITTYNKYLDNLNRNIK